MEAFTYDICQSTVALLVCVTTTYTDDVTDDDCDQVPIMEDDKHCQDDNSKTTLSSVDCIDNIHRREGKKQ